MHTADDITIRRAERLLGERAWPAVYAQRVPLDVAAVHLDGEPLPRSAIDATAFEPFEVGGRWGPPWGTSWFRFTGVVPPAFAGRRVEAVIDLGFRPFPGFSAEGLVWVGDRPLHGLHPRRQWSLIADPAVGGEHVELLVEAAANPTLFRRSDLGNLPGPAGDPIYQLRAADLAVLDTEVWHLAIEMEAVIDLIRQVDGYEPRRSRLVAALGRACDALRAADVAATAAAAREELAGALAAPGAPTRHHISLIGHAHIDTAWLWPLRETVRKCERTFSSAVQLMDSYPEYRFGCSQAVQYEWMRERHPALFERIQAKAASGQWVPLGGMWVESDTNLPGGESLVRQFLYGQHFFREHFGTTCREVWIPDVFGYPGSLPQIFRLAGTDAFLTQKLSWNRTNRFPHHTFRWTGIDGTSVLTHFPPVETYNCEVTPRELAHANRTFRDHGAATRSLAPFGHGDGGGGPTREHLERARLLTDCDGLPRVTVDSVTEFFDDLRRDDPDPPEWRGELYFEMHRGTYTSQARTKAGNRRCEQLLREAEWWAVATSTPVPELTQLWKDTLVLQFHDIIPGSSIGRVHRETEAGHERIAARLEAIIAELLMAAGDGRTRLINPAPVDAVAIDAHGRATLVPAGGTAEPCETPADMQPVVATERSLDNGLVRVEWDGDGHLTSITALGRELLPPGERGNVLELSEDLPLEYDAWDIEAYYRSSTRAVTDLRSAIVTHGAVESSVSFERVDGPSRFRQIVTVRAGSPRVDFELDVDWHHDEHLLKIAFPVDVHAERYAAETQFGHVFRPTHTNTSWDVARFEASQQRWIALAEPGFGVALLNDSKYGHDVLDGALRLTLLKASNYPGVGADRGHHRIRYALLPYAGDIAEVVAEGYRFNMPVRTAVSRPVSAPVRSTNPSVVVETLKFAEDGSGDWIVRCYEACGGRAAAELTFSRDVELVGLCDLLEDPLPADHEARRAVTAQAVDHRTAAVTLRPFRIVSLRLRPR